MERFLGKERFSDLIVVILGGGRGARLDPLTRKRSKPAVPIAGKYRLIDVTISNAINSGMERMFLLTQFNSVSLHRHIVRTYKFDFFSRGYVQILAARQTPEREIWFQGTADAVRQNLEIIEQTRGDDVLILAGDHMYRMDYRDMYRDHVVNEADITLAVHPASEEAIGSLGAVRVDDAGRVVEFREKPGDAAAREGMELTPRLQRQYGVATGQPYLGSMGIYIFKKEVLMGCLSGDRHDFGRHILPEGVGQLRIQAHFHHGYWRDIGTIAAFYDAHMDLLQPNPPFSFNDPGWPFYTHPRYLPASRITGCRFERTVLAEGGVLVDSTFEDSIIGIRSVIRKATIRQSLIMGSDAYPPEAPPNAPPVGIGEGSVIEKAIVDKNARIGREVRILNQRNILEAEGSGYVIREGILVVPKNAVIPDGTTI
ncbi:MAG TPA: sugar phosphate nucleotidyltransferase [Candidatus Polarisedimenticolia bacterium]|jgi:glucose-1-phosphate adenylyltransferase|nr:sugar phosphate nucleotidyltransferase [Candidatus Polarisedimenticolia bacterium]